MRANVILSAFVKTAAIMASAHSAEDPLTKEAQSRFTPVPLVPRQRHALDASTVFNNVLNIARCWDGRAADLMAQAGGPYEAP